MTTRRSRGQTMVLGCITLLMMAIMLMISFTLANAVHERIRMQASADAQAYSIAVVEARAFNSIAYANRAIAAALVADMSVSNWWSIAKWDASLFLGGGIAMALIAIEEIGQVSWVPSTWIHIAHFIEALVCCVRFFAQWISKMSAANNLKSKMEDAQKTFSTMIKDLHKDQKMILQAVPIQTTLVADHVNKQCSPKANMGIAQIMLNRNSFNDAIADGNGGNDRADIMMNAANDTRPGWDVGGVYTPMTAGDDYSTSYLQLAGMGLAAGALAGLELPGFPATATLNPEKCKDLMNNTGTYIWAGSSPATRNKSNSGTVSSGMAIGDSILEFGLGGSILIWRDGVAPGITFYMGHNTSGSDYKRSKCEDSDNCFTNYKGDTGGDMNQPTVFGTVKQSLREMRNGAARPWELNNGKVDVKVGSQNWNLSFVPENDAYAVSKAKVYFHQIDPDAKNDPKNGWKTPPNFFDPFWRAKLHPFDGFTELKKASLAAGDTNSLLYIGSVEGQ